MLHLNIKIMTSQLRWYLLLIYFNNKMNFLFSCEIRSWRLRFRQFDIMSSKYSTKQHISAQYCAKQMSEIWCKNIQEFLRYSNFHVGIFYFASPCIEYIMPMRSSLFLPCDQARPLSSRGVRPSVCDVLHSVKTNKNTGKFEVEVTNNKKLRSRYCTVEAVMLS